MTKENEALLFNMVSQILENQISKELNNKLNDIELSKSITLKNDGLVIVSKLTKVDKKPPYKRTKQERKESFKLSVKKHISEDHSFDLDVEGKFINYWTESNTEKSQMRFEKQDTFDIKRRLITWRKNSYGQRSTTQSTISDEEAVRIAENSQRQISW